MAATLLDLNIHHARKLARTGGSPKVCERGERSQIILPLILASKRKVIAHGTKREEGESLRKAQPKLYSRQVGWRGETPSVQEE